jgi:hypothetical protein
MQLGRFGSLVGFAVQVIGGGVALTHPEIGSILIVIGTVVLLVAIGHGVYSRRREIAEWRRRVGIAPLLLLIGVAGTWLFITIACAAAGWVIWTYPSGTQTAGVKANENEGPLIWFRNLEMEGGPNFRRNVFSLTFRGSNTSQKEVELKKASLISAINGTQIRLEVIAQGELVSVDQIELVPPGAPVQLVAKFGPPDPNAPGKVFGLEVKDFLETWRQFVLTVEDNVKTYRIAFNEGDLAPFFPGMAGPHVTKKK